MIRSTWSKWACLFRGHTRGKRQYQGIPVEGYILVTYACKRCGVEWRRKVARQVRRRAADTGGADMSFADMSPEQFRELCKAHDLTYSYSDDGRVYERGRAERKAIEEAAKELPRAVAVEIWNQVVLEKILPGPNGADMFLWKEGE